MSLLDYTINGLSQKIREDSITSDEILETYLECINNSVVSERVFSTLSETALRIFASKAQRQQEQSGELKPLHAIPIAVDDLIHVANTKTTFGSHVYENHVSESDSAAVKMIKKAGGYVIGKTRTSEFGVMADETLDNRISISTAGDKLSSGGGSAGVCAAVAMEFAPAGITLDFGCNVFFPAAFSGVHAFRPTPGRIPVTPAKFFGTLNRPVVSLITQNALDAAILINVLGKPNQHDPWSVTFPPCDFEKRMLQSIKPLRIAYVEALWNAPVSDEHRIALDMLVAKLRKMGCRVVRSRPSIRNPLDAWLTLFSANLYVYRYSDYADSNRELATPYFSRMLDRGQQTGVEELLKAQEFIAGSRKVLLNYFNDVDVLLLPATGCLPYPADATEVNLSDGNDAEIWKNFGSPGVVGAAFGVPVVQFPFSHSREGLPVCMMGIAKPGCDDILLSVSSAIQGGS